MKLDALESLGIAPKTTGTDSDEQVQTLLVALEVPDKIVLGHESFQARSTRPEAIVELGILVADVQLSVGLPSMTPQPLVCGESSVTMRAWPLLLP